MDRIRSPEFYLGVVAWVDGIIVSSPAIQCWISTTLPSLRPSVAMYAESGATAIMASPMR